MAANSPLDKNASMRRRLGDAEKVLLYIPPQAQGSQSLSGHESYAMPSPQPPPKMSDGGNGRPSYVYKRISRNESLCSTKGTSVSHLKKILDDPFETNMTKQQLARELIKYDTDEDGWVSTGEMLTAIVEVVDRLKLNVRDLDKIAMTRGTIGRKVAAKLHEKDKDGDGAIDADELVDAMEELVRDEESSKFWFRFSMVSCLLTLITIVVIVGLTVALQVSLKDTKVDINSLTLTAYRGSGQNQALRVASSDFAISPSGDIVPRGSNSSSLVNVATKLSTVTDCPISFDSEYLRHLEVIELDVTADQTLYLKPSAFIIGSGQVTFFTQLGNITFADK
jgi:Ca2+-binding EF-hand superfamily protein